MKKLLIAVLICLGVSTYAQEGHDHSKKGKGKHEMKSADKRSEMMLNTLTTQLGLNPSQVDKMKPIIAEQTAKMEELRAKMKENKDKGVEPTDADKKAMKKKMKEDKAATDAKVKAILTPEQYTKYESVLAELKEKGKDRKPHADH